MEFFNPDRIAANIEETTWRHRQTDARAAAFQRQDEGEQDMAWIYILRGAKGRYYIGSTENFSRGWVGRDSNPQPTP
jgi:hypothetical protein